MPPLQIYAPETLFRRQLSSYLAGLPTGWLVGSKTFDPGNLNNGAQATTGVTVAGAALGDMCLTPSFSLDTQGLVLTGQVLSANIVTVTFRNGTGSAIDLGSGTLRAAVLVD